MTCGRYKSRTLRRVHRKTPGGRNVLAYKRRKPGKPECAGCGRELKGAPRMLDFRMKKTAKTKKRPQRPYGGVLCSGCARRKIIEATRK